MFSIFHFAFEQIETILTIRQLSKRFKTLSTDDYITENFYKNNYGGVSVEIRTKSDFALLEKA
jgi:hypothetical protein